MNEENFEFLELISILDQMILDEIEEKYNELQKPDLKIVNSEEPTSHSE